MTSALRDFMLSFCPAVVRQASPPEIPHRTLQAATWAGLAQFFLAAWSFVMQLKVYLVQRAQQMAPQVTGQSEVVQAGITAIVFLEFLVHPLSFLLLYLAVEGLVRFMAGLVSAEVVPSILVFLAVKAAGLRFKLREQRQNDCLLPDSLELLPDGRIRISSARARPTWNASMTIGINGGWFEVERSEQTAAPRGFVYCLRPAPLGKVRRGYEEYDAASALRIETRPNGQPGERSAESAGKKMS